ncbi:MAG: DUF1638 domain-containing protein [Firmicutes bacterium]|nr:DUF1638 domain-containing protein [Bacillota bacterium]
MYFKLIACEVLTREICALIATTPHVIDPEFTDKAAHENSDHLRTVLQAKIDQAAQSGKKYDAILLAFGLCGNATVGLKARETKLVIPRAHDCGTLFLGSKEKFKEHFAANPSLAYSSTGYCERGASYLRSETQPGSTYEDYVRLYGEENAQYLWETLHLAYLRAGEKVVFIEIPETKHLGYAEKCRRQALEEQREYQELTGSTRLLRMLLYGDWPPEDFQIVEPHQETIGLYDWEEIIGVKTVAKEESEA